MKLSSFQAIVRVLNDANVPFIIVGGLAVNAHGYGRYTGDVELVIKLDPQAIRGAFEALASLGYRPRVPVTAEGFSDPDQRASWIADKGMTILGFLSDTHRETPIGMLVADPFDFDEEHREALVEEAAPGASVRILRLVALLKLKQEAGRPQDLADIAVLKQMHEAAVDA
ncbi:MAG: hypothetical protein ABR559_08975 [Gemmatimonadota bacterium]